MLTSCCKYHATRSLHRALPICYNKVNHVHISNMNSALGLPSVIIDRGCGEATRVMWLKNEHVLLSPGSNADGPDLTDRAHDDSNTDCTDGRMDWLIDPSLSEYVQQTTLAACAEHYNSYIPDQTFILFIFTCKDTLQEYTVLVRVGWDYWTVTGTEVDRSALGCDW